MTSPGRLRRAAIDVEPLRHADFRRLWLGNSLGFVGFQLTAVAVPVQVYEPVSYTHLTLPTICSV